MLIPGRESARGSPRRTQAPRTKFNGSGIGKKGGEVIRQPAQTRRTTTRSKATAAPENVNLVACPALALLVRSPEATARRSHAEARGDLHGRKHAHGVCVLTLEPLPPGRSVARHADHPPGDRKWAARSADADATDRALDPQCRPLRCLASRFDRSSGRLHDAAEPNARARDGPAAVAVRTPGSINLPGPCPWVGCGRFRGHGKTEQTNTRGYPKT